MLDYRWSGCTQSVRINCASSIWTDSPEIGDCVSAVKMVEGAKGSLLLTVKTQDGWTLDVQYREFAVDHPNPKYKVECETSSIHPLGVQYWTIAACCFTVSNNSAALLLRIHDHRRGMVESVTDVWRGQCFQDLSC